MSKKLRLFILFTILLVGLGLQILLKSYSQPIAFSDINILEYVEVDHQKSPTIVYIVDTRIKQSRDYITDVFAHLKKSEFRVNVIIVPLNTGAIELVGDYRLYKNELFGSIRYRKNAYYLFDETGTSRHGGVIAEYPAQLFSHIHQIFGVAPDYRWDHDLRPGEVFHHSVFSETIHKTRSPRKNNCYIVTGDNLCLGCKAGRLLLEFEKLGKTYPDVNFNFITAYNYSKDDIVRFKKNNLLETNILLASDQLKKRWEELGQINPLDSIMFVVTPGGTIALVTNNLHALKKWLGGARVMQKAGKP